MINILNFNFFTGLKFIFSGTINLKKTATLKYYLIHFSENNCHSKINTQNNQNPGSEFS